MKIINSLQARLSSFLTLCILLTTLLGISAYCDPTIDSSSDHLQRAVALVSRGDLTDAEKEARLALADSFTRPLALATLGAIRFQQKRLDASGRYLREAIQLNPNLVGARLTLGQVYARQGKTGLARQVFQQAMKLDPQNPLPRQNLGQLEAAKGNYKTSAEVVEPVSAALRGSPDGLLILLVINLGLGRKDVARALVSDWMALRQRVSPDLSINFARLLVDHGLASEAIQILENAKRSGPQSFDLAFALADAYLAFGDAKRASENYQQAANLNDRCAACFRQIAKIAESEGIYEMALANLLKAKALEPQNPEILFQFGRVCLEGDLLRDATPALERAVQLEPGNDRFAYVLASAYVGKMRYTDALAILDRLLKKHPENPILNYAYGSVLYMRGMDLDGAEKYLKKSISLQPVQVAAYYYLGMVAIKKGDKEWAEAIFREILQRYPDHLASLEQFGRILVNQGKNDEAQQVFEKVLRLDPRSQLGHYQYGLLLFRLGKKEESSKHLQIARELEDVRRKDSKGELYLLNPE